MTDAPARRRGRPKADVDPHYDGSRPLAAPRRELFSCYAAKLGSLTDAYIAANYTCSSRSVASRNGSRLKTRESGVKERIDFLAQLSDEAFEPVFEAAKRRVAAQEASELGGGDSVAPAAREGINTEGEISKEASREPVTRAELISTRDVLELAVRRSRELNEFAKAQNLGANIRKRILALHSSAVIRLLEKLDRLLLADQITAEAEVEKAPGTSAISAADIRRKLVTLRRRTCTCGS